MIIDKRKKNKLLKFAISIKPSDSKESDFHLALADYLYKELKNHGLNVVKNSVILKVAIKNGSNNKYENVIIDCLNGRMFLRGKEVNDRYFGKFRKFEGRLPGEAYHCVVKSAEGIINRIKNLQDKLSKEGLEVVADIEKIDLRKKKVKNANLDKKEILLYKDLRKKSNMKDLRRKSNMKDLRKKHIKDLRNNVKEHNLISKKNYPASAYKWVEERAKHLMEVSDMNEGMAYGVAWNQYKKKQNNKKKKKAYISRLAKTIYNEIQQGDYVDFGIYGKGYVSNLNFSEQRFWVTDDKERRDDIYAPGRAVLKSHAVEIIEHYNEYDDDYNEYNKEYYDYEDDDDFNS